jgi:peptidoglycan/LPS O-acetylase OafA/YrhL
LLHRWRLVWEGSPVLVLVCLTLLASALVALDHLYAAVYVLLPFMVVWFGSLSTPLVSAMGRYGDLSYGIYIYAYVVQQSVIAVIGFHHSYAMTLSASIVVTLACAFASWRLVERPALGLKRHLRVRSRDGDGGNEKGGVLAMA